MTTSKRKARDGFSLFGVRSPIEEFNKKLDYIMDIQIFQKNDKEAYSNLVFMIYFCLDQTKYFIRAYTPDKKSEKEKELPYIIVQITKPFVKFLFSILRKRSF